MNKLNTSKFSLAYLLEITTSRNHELLSYPNPFSRQGPLNLRCLTCGHEWETTIHNYSAAKNGCWSCKKAIISKTHRDKDVKQSTRDLIGIKASLRPGSLTGVTGHAHPCYKNGYGRDKQELSNLDYVWKNAVRKRCHSKCIVTGIPYGRKNQAKEDTLVCHHLNSWCDHENQRYLPENGVLLKRSIHSSFHNIFGYGKNTEKQFAEFLKQQYGLEWVTTKQNLN